MLLVYVLFVHVLVCLYIQGGGDQQGPTGRSVVTPSENRMQPILEVGGTVVQIQLLERMTTREKHEILCSHVVLFFDCWRFGYFPAFCFGCSDFVRVATTEIIQWIYSRETWLRKHRNLMYITFRGISLSKMGKSKAHNQKCANSKHTKKTCANSTVHKKVCKEQSAQTAAQCYPAQY